MSNKKKKSFFFRKLRLGLKKVNIKLKRKFFGKIKKEFLSNVYKINFFLDLKKVEAYFENKFCSSFYTKERKSYFLKKLRVYFLCKNKKKFIKYFLLTKFLVNNKKNIVSSKKNTFIYIKKRCGTYRLQYTNLKKKNSLAHTNCRDTLVKVKLGLLNKKRVGFKNFIVELLTLEKAILLITKKYFMQNLSVNFFFINNYNYTAQVLVNYICIKLKQKFTLNQVIRPLIKYLTKLIKKRYLFGFRIMLNGRFTRKQRATKMVLKGGSVPLATLDNNVDYYEDFVSLKDGVGGIKIWLNRTIKAKKACIGIKSN